MWTVGWRLRVDFEIYRDHLAGMPNIVDSWAAEVSNEEFLILLLHLAVTSVGYGVFKGVEEVEEVFAKVKKESSSDL